MSIAEFAFWLAVALALTPMLYFVLFEVLPLLWKWIMAWLFGGGSRPRL